MNKADIPFLSASELSDLIKKREVSSVEAVEVYLDRIDSLNGKLFAYLTVCRDEALQAAREADQALAQGQILGPMHGVPVAVKDQINSAGIRTTGGSPIFNDVVPTEDATVLANLKSAGAVLLGKLNMTEFATTGLSHGYDTARNPWDTDRFTGGSSSGSGAATAAFMCAASLGEDTGGSVRFPATWCGLMGLRPTWGRVSRYGVMPGVWSMDQIGPITRTVEDCALTLQAIAGQDRKDPYTSSAPVPDYRQALDGNIRGLRVGVVKEMLHNQDVDPEIRNAVLAAANGLGELGATVDEVSLPMTSHAGTISGSIRIEAPTNYRDLLLNHLQEIRHDNRIGFLTSNILPATAYYKAQKLRALLRQEVLDALQDFDVLVTPTAGVAAQKVEPDPAIESKDGTNRMPWLLTTAFSLASIPAASICCGFTEENLPIGLQIGGRPFEEGKILNVAYAYEQANEWRLRKPRI
jgi:aspartyl-tRNA(Asn)/glutamyl-tRNA(Gln) amidotransferase subunit A